MKAFEDDILNVDQMMNFAFDRDRKQSTIAGFIHFVFLAHSLRAVKSWGCVGKNSGYF